ncbi:MAG: efflux RND transporter periplasmic adaptor subunit, partial [Saprospiraceae bacterium]
MWIYISFASILMLGLGLGIGYFIFSNPPTLVGHEEHQHNDVQSNRESEIWTCSMHPQIRQNEPGICPICEMDLIPLESNTSNDPLVLQMTEEAVKLSNIQTSIIGVESGSTGKIIKLTGKVQSDERKASSQVSHVAGRIEKLYVNFTGEEVMVGQKLADIYAPDLITAQQELLEALKMQEFNSGLAETVRQKLRYWKIS